jgi:glutamyl-tRNA reductase
MIKAVTLDKLKKIVEDHMKKELDIMEIILKLDKSVVEEFHRWYISHPYCKGIDELRQVVRKRADKED